MMSTLFKTTRYLTLIALFGLAAASPVHADGGVNGGGGGVVPSDPVNARQIEQVATKAKIDLILYLNKLGLAKSFPPAIYWERIFGGKKRIQEAIQTGKIEFREDAPCVDPAGIDKDGAAPGNTPDSICISVKNLALKLNSDNYRAQTLGLIAHEFSHLVGTTESEAVSLQKDVIREFAGTSDEEIRGTLRSSEMGTLHLLEDLRELKRNLQNHDPHQRALRVLAIQSEQNLGTDPNVGFGDGTIYPLNKEMQNLLSAVSFKIQALQWSACASDATDTGPQSNCRKHLTQVFGDDTQITLSTFLARSDNYPLPDAPNLAIRKITDDSILVLELTDILQAFEDMNLSLQALLALDSEIKLPPRISARYECTLSVMYVDLKPLTAEYDVETTDGLNSLQKSFGLGAILACISVEGGNLNLKIGPTVQGADFYGPMAPDAYVELQGLPDFAKIGYRTLNDGSYLMDCQKQP